MWHMRRVHDWGSGLHHYWLSWLMKVVRTDKGVLIMRWCIANGWTQWDGASLEVVLGWWSWRDLQPIYWTIDGRAFFATKNNYPDELPESIWLEGNIYGGTTSLHLITEVFGTWTIIMKMPPAPMAWAELAGTDKKVPMRDVSMAILILKNESIYW
jgi:hypothetical protein